MLDENDNGGQIELLQGQELTISLPSNPSTGYGWQARQTEESILEQAGEAAFIPSTTSDSPHFGAGGREVFKYQAIAPGYTTLSLVYSRSWEVDVEPLKTFSVHITVREAGTIR